MIIKTIQLNSFLSETEVIG